MSSDLRLKKDVELSQAASLKFHPVFNILVSFVLDVIWIFHIILPFCMLKVRRKSLIDLLFSFNRLFWDSTIDLDAVNFVHFEVAGNRETA
jgi:hypothetical protein